VPAILEKRRRNEARRCRTEEARTALKSFVGEIAFVPAGNSQLTRELKKTGAYEEVLQQTDFTSSELIGYRVPDESALKVLQMLGLPHDPVARLTRLLRYLFQINLEAKQSPGWHSTAGYRYGKKEHLLVEACRLASKQDVYVWGWKQDPDLSENGPEWVLYFEHDGQQVSFHSFKRGEGPEFSNDWDGKMRTEFPWNAGET
jgi:hypothetical protein